MVRVLGLLMFFLFCFSGLAQKKVALVSVYVDKRLIDVPWEPLILEKFYETMNYDSLSMDFKDRLFAKYIGTLPIDLIPEAEVIGREGYSNLATKPFNENLNRRQCAEGYVFIESRPMHRDKDDFDKALGLFPEAELLLVCFLDFEFDQYQVGGQNGFIPMQMAKIVAHVNFKFFTRDGKPAFTLREKARSKSSMVVGAFQKEKTSKDVQKLTHQAMKRLYEDLDKKLTAKKKKVASKLSKL